MKFPVFSQLAGKLGFRDGFARDSLLQRRVCELSVPPENPVVKARRREPGFHRYSTRLDAIGCWVLDPIPPMTNAAASMAMLELAPRSR